MNYAMLHGTFCYDIITLEVAHFLLHPVSACMLLLYAVALSYISTCCICQTESLSVFAEVSYIWLIAPTAFDS